MPAYIITDFRITDPERYEQYKQVSPIALKQYGGRFVVRGGDVLTLEGDWKPGRVVVLEFENVEQARAWWNSEEYREPKALRQSASTGSMILVAGVDHG